MAKLERTDADLVTSFTIFFNGEKLGGVQKFVLDVDLEGTLLTKVHLDLAIKRDSFKIYKKNGYRVFSFQTTNCKENLPKFNKVNKKYVYYHTRCDHSENDIVVMNGKQLDKVVAFSFGPRASKRTSVQMTTHLTCGGFRVECLSNGRKTVYLDTR